MLDWHKLSVAPLISFKLIAKGVDEMQFKIVTREAIRVLGVSVPISKDSTKAYEEAEALWEKILTEGAPMDADGIMLNLGTIWKELNAACEPTLPELAGFFGIEIEHNEGNRYMIAVASSQPESVNLKEYIISAHTWAMFLGKNFFADEYSDAESSIKLEERIYTEWLPTSGYTLADSLDVHLLHPTDNLENTPFEQWLPVKKNSGMTV